MLSKMLNLPGKRALFTIYGKDILLQLKVSQKCFLISQFETYWKLHEVKKCLQISLLNIARIKED